MVKKVVDGIVLSRKQNTGLNLPQKIKYRIKGVNGGNRNIRKFQ